MTPPVASACTFMSLLGDTILQNEEADFFSGTWPHSPPIAGRRHSDLYAFEVSPRTSTPVRRFPFLRFGGITLRIMVVGTNLGHRLRHSRFWLFSKILMFEIEVVPRNWTPECQTGFITAVCINGFRPTAIVILHFLITHPSCLWSSRSCCDWQLVVSPCEATIVMHHQIFHLLSRRHCFPIEIVGRRILFRGRKSIALTCHCLPRLSTCYAYLQRRVGVGGFVCRSMSSGLHTMRCHPQRQRGCLVVDMSLVYII